MWWDEILSTKALTDWKDAVVHATTAALPAYSRVGNVITADANGAIGSIDGVAATLGGAFLLWHGASGVDNGIYTWTTLGSGSGKWSATRRADCDGSVTGPVNEGMKVHIARGTLHGGKTARLTTTGPITVGTTALAFTPEPTATAIGVGALVAALRADIGSTEGERRYLKGYTTAGDGGEGPFQWRTGTATDDGGTILHVGGYGVAHAGYWEREYSGPLSARWYGADSTGAADSTTAINRAIQACSNLGGGIVVFPTGSYLYSSQLTLRDGVELVGAGIDSTTLTTVGYGGTPAVDFPDGATMYGEGSYTLLDGLAGNVSEGGTSLTLSSDQSALLSAGSYIFVYNSTNSSFSAARTYYREGEFCQVRSVAGATVTLVEPLRSDYTAGATLKVYRLNPVRCAIRSMSIRGFSATDLVSLIAVKYAVKLDFSDLYLSGTDNAHLLYQCAMDVKISNVRVFDTNAAAGYNYGVVGANVQSVRISDCDITTSRIATDFGGGDYIGCVPNRDCTVSDSFLRSNRIGGVGAANMHGNCEHVVYRNCTATGAYLSGDHCGYENCTIYSSTTLGEAVYVTEPLGADFWVKGCKLIATKNVDSSSGLLVWQGQTSVARTGGVLRVSDTEIVLGPFTGKPWRLQNAAGSTEYYGVEFQDVLVTADTADSANSALITNGNGLGMDRASFQDVTLINCALDLSASNLRTITMDSVKVLGSPGFGILLNANAVALWSTQYVKIANSTVSGSDTAGMALAGQSQTFSILDLVDCTSVDNAGTPVASSLDSSIVATAWLVATIKDNSVGDTRAVQKQVYTIVTNTITTLYADGNRDIGSAPLTLSLTTTARGAFDVQGGLTEVESLRFVGVTHTNGQIRAGNTFQIFEPGGNAIFNWATNNLILTNGAAGVLFEILATSGEMYLRAPVVRVKDTGGTDQFVFDANAQKFGFGVAAVAKPAAYTPTNVSADRSYDANSTSVDELADVLGTLIADLQLYGWLQ